MIEVEHIFFSYGKNPILNDVGFRVDSGERVAVTGRNGCGKSTLLQIMAGIIQPEKGTLKYYNQDMLSNKKLFRKYCGYVPQENPLMEELSVRDNLRLWNQGKKIIPEEVVLTNGLEDLLTCKVSTLSGGMKRRLSIACAMLDMPPIMLMDEPTTALDMEYREQIREWLEHYQKMGGTLVIVTHIEEEIEASDKRIVLD